MSRPWATLDCPGTTLWSSGEAVPSLSGSFTMDMIGGAGGSFEFFFPSSIHNEVSVGCKIKNYAETPRVPSYPKRKTRSQTAYQKHPNLVYQLMAHNLPSEAGWASLHPRDYGLHWLMNWNIRLLKHLLHIFFIGSTVKPWECYRQLYSHPHVRLNTQKYSCYSSISHEHWYLYTQYLNTIYHSNSLIQRNPGKFRPPMPLTTARLSLHLNSPPIYE